MSIVNIPQLQHLSGLNYAVVTNNRHITFYTYLCVFSFNIFLRAIVYFNRKVAEISLIAMFHIYPEVCVYVT